MSIEFNIPGISKVLAVVLAVAATGVAHTAVGQGLEPGALSPNQAIAAVAEKLPSGVSLSNATPAQLQSAIYSATRDAPAQAGAIAGAVVQALPAQAATVSSAVTSALSDSAAAGAVSPTAVQAIGAQVRQTTSPAAAAATPASGGFFPSAAKPVTPTVSTGTSSVQAVTSGG